MAKRSGLTFKDEKEFAKEFTPQKLHPSALKQIVEQLRAQNIKADVKPALDPAKISADPAKAESVAKQEQSLKEETKHAEKRTDKLIESQKKLTTNIDKLANHMANAVARNKVGATRAEEIAGKQKLDYRTVGQQFKDKLMGRGGDKWDRESLKYKFGSVRGIAGTLGLRGIPGFDNAMAKREEIKQTATRMTEMNAGMQNLKGFAVRDAEGKVNQEASKKNVEKYYQEKGKKAEVAKANLQSEEYNRNKFREAGISDEEFDRTSGGKQQNKKLAEAGQAVINTDPRMQGEKKGALGGEDSDKLNVSQEESSQLKAIEDISRPSQELVAITRAENARKEKADHELLAAVQNIKAVGGEGGGVGGVGDALGKIGGKGKGGKLGRLGKLGRAANIASKAAPVAEAAGSAAVAGEGALAGGAALAGEGAAVAGGGGMLAAGGAALAAAAPFILGAAVIGGIGYLGYKGYQKWKKNKEEKAKLGNKAQENLNEKQAIQGPVEKANEVMQRSSDNESAKFTGSLNKSPTNIVNAPTTISKSTQNTAMHVPIRDYDHSIRSYYRSRFAS